MSIENAPFRNTSPEHVRNPDTFTTDDVELLDRMIAVIRAAGFMPGTAAEMGELREKLAAASE